MYVYLSKVFPFLSQYQRIEEISKKCVATFTSINPYVKKGLDQRIKAASHIKITGCPIIVPWFKGVRKQLTAKEFRFTDK